MTRVFIPQHPVNLDLFMNSPSPDLSGVMKFGAPIFMLPQDRLWPTKMKRTVKTLEAAMFDFGPADYLLATGDVLAIAAAIHIALRRTNGTVNVIRYFRKTNEFKPFVMTIGAGHAEDQSQD